MLRSSTRTLRYKETIKILPRGSGSTCSSAAGCVCFLTTFLHAAPFFDNLWSTQEPIPNVHWPPDDEDEINDFAKVFVELCIAVLAAVSPLRCPSAGTSRRHGGQRHLGTIVGIVTNSAKLADCRRDGDGRPGGWRQHSRHGVEQRRRLFVCRSRARRVVCHRAGRWLPGCDGAFAAGRRRQSDSARPGNEHRAVGFHASACARGLDNT